MKRRCAAKLLSAVLFLGLSACGGGGAGGAGTPQQKSAAPKTATIGFSTANSATTAPLQGIQITVKLPPGITIANLGTALSGDATIGQVIPGAYSAADQTVTFAVAPAAQNNSINFGKFAELKCDVILGAVIDENSFVALNTPNFPDLQMYGVVGGTSVDLVPQIPIKLSVSFGY